MVHETANPAKSPVSLTADQLCPICDLDRLSFDGPEQHVSDETLLGQDRAMGAIGFGAAITHPGFNIFVLGPEGSGRHTAVMRLLSKAAAKLPAPKDWVYVHNFKMAWKPVALCLPAGKAIPFRDAIITLMEDLRTSIPALFETDAYREQRREIEEAAEDQQHEKFDALSEKAKAKEIGVIRTPMGFALAPLKDGQVVKPEDFNTWPQSQRDAIQKDIETLQKELTDILQDMPEIEKQRRNKIRALNAEMAATVIDRAIDGVRDQFTTIQAIGTHLDAMRMDLLDRVEVFVIGISDEQDSPFPEVSGPIDADPRFRRYLVNPIVANGKTEGPMQAPVDYEDHPTLAHLVGRTEHLSRMGILETDFLMIRPGALHRANGGFLVLDARKILREPWAWDALKRALQSASITISSAAQELSLASTVSLEPEPIPLNVKVILIGERILYYLLFQLDPEFGELFKVQADFDEEIEWSDETLPHYGRLISTIADSNTLKPLDKTATGAVMNEAARLANDAERLSLRLGALTDLMREADYWATTDGREHMEAGDIARAIDERTGRADRVRKASHEMITREIRLIDTDGEAVGQVNGLSVMQLAGVAFGQPTRITARVRMGTGKVVDIERETKLGGPIHSKGVLILSSFLSATYALDRPMSLWASLVFEQSYGGVEGDSASSAELYALLSALSGVAIRQDLAVTGSVNQLGEVQAIGGVNEKIEGFFDICNERGLTGTQGVLIPQSNTKHLVLRPRVVEAVREGQFHVYPVGGINQGIEILTGVTAGIRQENGCFPDGTINGLAEARLEGFANARRAFSEPDEDGNDPKK